MDDPPDGIGSVELERTKARSKVEIVRWKPKAAVLRALQLDANLTEAHVLLADIEQAQWHWAEAQREYQRALELSPKYWWFYLAFTSFVVALHWQLSR